MDATDRPTLSPSPHPLSLVTSELSVVDLGRLHRVVPEELLRTLLSHGAFVAGGCAVFAVVDSVTPDAVGDVDVFVPATPCGGTDLFLKLVRLVDESLPYPKRYQRQQATLRIHSRGRYPIQLIHAPGGLEDVLRSFDFDYVQCAISAPLDGAPYVVTRTLVAVESHRSRVIRYALDYPYNPRRLFSRLSKAAKKGFSVPSGYANLGELGLKLYRPDTVPDQRWRDEKQQRLPAFQDDAKDSGPAADLDRLYDDYERMGFLPARTTLHDDLGSALRAEIYPFTREIYEGEPEIVGQDEDDASVARFAHARFDEQSVWFDVPVTHVLLGGLRKGEPLAEGVREGPPAIDPFARLVRDLRARVNAMKSGSPDERRLFFLVRAYELVLERDYGGAVMSAMSDVRKLGAFSLPDFALASATGHVGAEITRAQAIETVERLLGTAEGIDTAHFTQK
ncbi:Hypothetical protein UVM_LOCUS204 [uncultured virus]|nr:Hypothetical protein UVM_LOCUS204 [uncultured virus]